MAEGSRARMPEALSFPLCQQCPPLSAPILASATSTPAQECTCDPVALLRFSLNADGHFGNSPHGIPCD
uniref:Uncharacterized protein n=1 Tax=Setaria italica TaxID=4555 RepID=K3ZGH9_SETIT